MTEHAKGRVTKNPCTVCGAPGIPGLFQGAGKCRYHWNAGAYGKPWADAVEAEAKKREAGKA